MYEKKALVQILDPDKFGSLIEKDGFFTGMTIVGLAVTIIGSIGRTITYTKQLGLIGKGWSFTTNNGHHFEKVCADLDNMKGKIFTDP